MKRGKENQSQGSDLKNRLYCLSAATMMLLLSKPENTASSPASPNPCQP